MSFTTVASNDDGDESSIDDADYDDEDNDVMLIVTVTMLVMLIGVSWCVGDDVDRSFIYYCYHNRGARRPSAYTVVSLRFLASLEVPILVK